MRKIVIIGAGSFGYHVAETLYKKGHEVLVIDKDKTVIQKIKDFCTQAVYADATDKETLEALGVKDMDAAVVSLGDRIEPSILVTLYLKELGVKEIIVKALSEDHAKILKYIGATEIIFPERDVAQRLANRLSAKNMLDYLNLAPGYSILEIVPPKKFVGKSLKELALRSKYGIQIIAVKELVPEKVDLVPGGDFVIKDSDILIVVGKDEDLEKLSKGEL